MKIALLLSLISLFTTGLYLFSQENQGFQSFNSVANQDIFNKFQAWKQEHGITYFSKDEQYRFIVFLENYFFIQQHNAQNSNLKLGLNQFAAMSNEEFRQVLLNNQRKSQDINLQQPTKLQYNSGDYSSSIPDELNWNQKGAVYETQNQGTCGSCWAFSSIGGLQGLRQIVTGKLELLSVQQLVSCMPKDTFDDKKQGCGGGLPEYAYQYTAQTGIELAADYPYTDGKSTVASPCKLDPKKVVFKNEGRGTVAPQDVQGMLENVNNQPLSIGVDAGSIYFQLYKDGIIQENQCSTNINHSILLVGYNITNKQQPYWIVQNSWGSGWGLNGFANVQMSEGTGACAINMQVDFPTSIHQKN